MPSNIDRVKKKKQEALNKLAAQYFLDNKELLEDYYDICHKVLHFHLLWGLKIGIHFENPEEPKGRSLTNQ